MGQLEAGEASDGLAGFQSGESDVIVVRGHEAAGSPSEACAGGGVFRVIQVGGHGGAADAHAGAKGEGKREVPLTGDLVVIELC